MFFLCFGLGEVEHNNEETVQTSAPLSFIKQERRLSGGDLFVGAETSWWLVTLNHYSALPWPDDLACSAPVIMLWKLQAQPHKNWPLRKKKSPSEAPVAQDSVRTDI